MRRDSLPSNARRRPSRPMHFGAPSRGLRTPCERFAPWVTQAHASLGSGWWPTLAGWGWIPTGFRTRFRRSHHGILSSLTGLSRHTRWCMARSYRTGRPSPERGSRHSVTVGHAETGHPRSVPKVGRRQFASQELRCGHGSSTVRNPARWKSSSYPAPWSRWSMSRTNAE